MNKSTIFIGLGILAVGGLAYWYFTKPSAGTTSDASDLGKSATPPMDEVYDESGSVGGVGGAAGLGGAPKSRKQTRRDCRAEAKSRGLRGKAKRQFRRECKRSGGMDDGADFAFNGFDGAFEFA
jgi:hypothetical protein